jgi:uncharacterized protein YkwD
MAMGSVAPETVYRRSGKNLNSCILAAAALIVLAIGVTLELCTRTASASTPTGSALTAAGSPCKGCKPTPSTSTVTGGSCRNTHLLPTSSDLPAVVTATVCLIDRERLADHLLPLRPNNSLRAVAANQSQEMVLGDYFGDDSRSGQTPLQRIVATRYLGRAAQVSTAQNIGWGTRAYATPADVVQAWMDSPPHRQIILTGEYRNIGVGVAPAAPAALAQGQPGATYTVEFGVRLPS